MAAKRQTGFEKLVNILKGNQVEVDEAGLQQLLRSNGIDPDAIQDGQIGGLVDQLINLMNGQAQHSLVVAPPSVPAPGAVPKRNGSLTVPTLPLETQQTNQQGSTAGMGVIADRVNQTREMTGQILTNIDQEVEQNAALIFGAVQGMPHAVLELVGQATFAYRQQGGAAEAEHFRAGIANVFTPIDGGNGGDETAALA